jgi:hypothetical protein
MLERGSIRKKKSFALTSTTVSVFGQFLFDGRNGKMLVAIRGYLTLIKSFLAAIEFKLNFGNLIFKKIP